MRRNEAKRLRSQFQALGCRFLSLLMIILLATATEARETASVPAELANSASSIAEVLSNLSLAQDIVQRARDGAARGDPKDRDDASDLLDRIVVQSKRAAVRVRNAPSALERTKPTQPTVSQQHVRSGSALSRLEAYSANLEKYHKRVTAARTALETASNDVKQASRLNYRSWSLKPALHRSCLC